MSSPGTPPPVEDQQQQQQPQQAPVPLVEQTQQPHPAEAAVVEEPPRSPSLSPPPPIQPAVHVAEPEEEIEAPPSPLPQDDAPHEEILSPQGIEEEAVMTIPDINIHNPTPSVSETGPVDWHAMYQKLEKDLQTSEARNASLERLLQAQQQSSATKVRQLTEELARRNRRIKEHDASQKAASSGSLLPASPPKMSRRKSVDSTVSSAQAGVIRDLEKKLRHAAGEKERLESVLASQARENTSVASCDRNKQSLLLVQARDAINELRRQLTEKEAAMQLMQVKLTEAQSAILTNVEGISDLDSKLQQSRKALRWLLRQQGSSPMSRSRSPSPSYGVVQQALPPTYVQHQGGGYPVRSVTPQHILQQHDSLARSHLGHEQLTALRELEAMLAAREQAQRGY